MATDAVVSEQSHDLTLPPDLTTVVQLGPLQTGRSYVIWAKGSIIASNAEAYLELDFRRDRQGGDHVPQGHGARLLLARGRDTLPARRRVLRSGKTLGARTGRSDPSEDPGYAIVKNVKIVALAVDTLEVQTA